MIELYCMDEGTTHQTDVIEDGVWIKLTAPTADEVEEIASSLSGVDPADIAAANDPEEKTRVEYEDDYSLVLVDIPVPEVRHGLNVYQTIPLGVLLLEHNIVTVCAQDTPILNPFQSFPSHGLSTRQRRRFLYQILLRTALLYQHDLSSIDRMRREFEEKVQDDTSEDDLVGLHELESTLVYFATSLGGNGSVMTRLQRSSRLRPDPSNEDLLEDAVTETQQAIEMAQIYRDIIDGTRNLTSSLMDLRLNSVMQRLTSITLILSIPTVISGLYGMNVNSNGMPFANMEYAFGLICLITAVVCLVLSLWLVHRKWM